MSEPGRDPREADDNISAAHGQGEIGRLINLKLAERAKIQKQLDVLEGEIAGLRAAEYAIERLSIVKRAATDRN